MNHNIGVDCLLCGSDKVQDLYKGLVFRCSECRFIFVDNKERAEQQKVFLVEENSSIENVQKLKDKYKKDYHNKRVLYSNLAENISNYFKNSLEGIKILDVGACGGFFLHEVEKVGGNKNNMCCLEISNDYIRLAEEYFGYKSIRSNIEDFVSEEKYDVVSLLDVLEHVSDFRKAMARISAIMKSNGILILKLPNGNWTYLKCLLAKVFFPDKMRKFLYLEPGGHLNYWNANNINLLEKAGFKVSKIEYPRPSKEQFKNKYYLKLFLYYLSKIFRLNIYPEFLVFLKLIN